MAWRPSGAGIASRNRHHRVHDPSPALSVAWLAHRKPRNGSACLFSPTHLRPRRGPRAAHFGTRHSGVFDFLRFGDQVARVSQAEIDTIEAMIHHPRCLWRGSRTVSLETVQRAFLFGYIFARVADRERFFGLATP